MAGVDAVMLQFQQVMSQFLNTQGAIMSAYLGGGNPDEAPPFVAAQPAAAAAPARPAVAARPVQPVPQPPPAFAPAPVVVDQPASIPVVADRTAPSTVDFAALLVQVAAERTGYPADMLRLDLGIEADLGIDSIKRVEILSSVGRHCSEADQQRLQSAMDALTRVKTLREMAAAMTAAVAGAPVVERAPTPPAPARLSLPASSVPVEEALPRVVFSATTRRCSSSSIRR